MLCGLSYSGNKVMLPTFLFPFINIIYMHNIYALLCLCFNNIAIQSTPIKLLEGEKRQLCVEDRTVTLCNEKSNIIKEGDDFNKIGNFEGYVPVQGHSHDKVSMGELFESRSTGTFTFQWQVDASMYHEDVEDDLLNKLQQLRIIWVQGTVSATYINLGILKLKFHSYYIFKSFSNMLCQCSGRRCGRC